MKNIKKHAFIVLIFSMNVATARTQYVRPEDLPENFEDESWKYTLGFGSARGASGPIKRDPHWGFVNRKFVRREGWIWKKNRWICDQETNPDCVETVDEKNSGR
jgi:hypothetical protein